MELSGPPAVRFKEDIGTLGNSLGPSTGKLAEGSVGAMVGVVAEPRVGKLGRLVGWVGPKPGTRWVAMGVPETAGATGDAMGASRWIEG